MQSAMQWWRPTLWRRGGEASVSWLLPENCRFCSAPGAAICSDCQRELPRLPSDRCSWCALPVDDGGDCPVCSIETPSYDYTFCPFVYTSPLAEAISAWKFHAGLDWTRPLANAWIQAWAGEAPLRPEALVPVPAHPARLRERGYNQAALLARQWGRHYHVPVRDVLRRVRNTPHQVGGSREQRRANLRAAFALRARLPQHVALVDDVLTTGSTAEALAQLLKAEGVARVDLWMLARAL